MNNLSIYRRWPLPFFALIALIFNCCSEEETPETAIEPIESIKIIEFSSFEITNNSEEELRTLASLTIQGFENLEIREHGIELFYDNEFIIRFDQGQLNALEFESSANTHLVLGRTYSVRPFIRARGDYIYGGFIEFENKVNVNITISTISPLQGFVNDTITITGQNFCNTISSVPNFLSLEGYYQNTIVESDTLIRSVLIPNVQKSVLPISLVSCGIETPTEFEFVFDPPELDSLSSQQKFVGEYYNVYAKNVHAQLSKIWLADIEVPLNKDNPDTDRLEFNIPPNLPSGKLDFKMQVIDRVIELTKAYQSTTPVITEVENRMTGFLDTITIKGDYLIQGDKPLEVLIGERPQTILERSPQEIQVIINNYFEVEEPKLELVTGSFTLEEDITMKAPQIISVDKEKYHLQGDVVVLKTKYFFGGKRNINVANEDLYLHAPFEPITEKGEVFITLEDWLELDSSHPEFSFQNDGELEIRIFTKYGEVTAPIKIFAPTISNINKNEFYQEEYITIEGDDFGYNIGYRGTSNIYIDDELMPFSGNSNYSFRNKRIRFPLPNTLSSGEHTLKIITGGQSSNEVTFQIIPLIPDGLVNNSGTRNDVFEISGTNMDGGVVKVFANGTFCDIIDRSPTKISFMIPYFLLLNDPVEITLEYGPDVFNVGTVNGIEPYQDIQEYTMPDIAISTHVANNSSYFMYDGSLHLVNFGGIFKFDLASRSWQTITTETSIFEYGFSQNRQLSVVDDTVYIPYGNSFIRYNFTTGQWQRSDLDLGENRQMELGHVIGSFAYIFVEDNTTREITFYRYHLENHEMVSLSPSIYPSKGHFDYFYVYNGMLYLDVQNENILRYDPSTDSWTDLGYPIPYKYRFNTNLVFHNNTLFLSGGRGNGEEFFDLYSYDIGSGQWSEKTFLPERLKYHTVFGEGDSLYFLLGSGLYGIPNQKLYSYDINLDPN